MSKFWLLRMREKQKSLLNYARLVGKYVGFFEKLIFRHSYAHESKTSPKKRRWWKVPFFRCCPAVTKGLKKVTNLFQIGLFPHKKVKFAKFSTKQVYNVTMKQFQCLLLKILVKVEGQFNLEVCSIHPFLCIWGGELYNFMEQLKASDKISAVDVILGSYMRLNVHLWWTIIALRSGGGTVCTIWLYIMPSKHLMSCFKFGKKYAKYYKHWAEC